MQTVQNYKLSKTKYGKQGCTALIICSRKIGLKKCAEFVQNSQKWCAEIASYACRIFNFFGTAF